MYQVLCIKLLGRQRGDRCASGDKQIRGRGYLEMTGYAGESMGDMLR